jgi:integrase
MATGNINLTTIGKLDGWLWDQRTCGFGVRRQTNGTFYYVRYRHGGSQIVRSIGRHGSPWTPDTARAKAKALLGQVASGVDPFAPAITSDTFGVVVQRYLERKRATLRPKSFAEVSRYLVVQALPLHALALAQIDRRKIAALLGGVEDASGAVSRNRCRSALSAFFAWAIAEGYVEVNPVAGTARAGENGGRERVLSQDEQARLWAGLSNEPFDDIVRLLLLTGQRKMEIAALRWEEVDLAQGLIALPASRTKNGRAHTLPLSRQALAIIERQPHRNSTDYVFADGGALDWDRSKARLDGRVGLAPFVLHDCRRTVSTGMAELGVLPHIIEAVLNHQSGHKAGVAGIYNRARYADEMRAALQRWADHLVEKITA